VSFDLKFSRFAAYDAGKPGISVPAVLRSKNVSVQFTCKLDTGATDCVFARQLGEQLGLDIEEGEKIEISTATGNFTAYGHDVTMSILDFDFDAFVFFARDESFNRNVLGRRGFLDQVVLGLVDYEGKLYLNYYE
jgi:Aspartyl protease